MKESYGEELATHAGLVSCVGARKGALRSVDRGEVGPVLSRETTMKFQEADTITNVRRQHGWVRPWRASSCSCAVLDPVHAPIDFHTEPERAYVWPAFGNGSASGTSMRSRRR